MDPVQPSTVPSSVISPQLARWVLWFFRSGGEQPGSFTTYLLEAIAHADTENLERLRVSFPNHVRAVLMARSETYGIDRLRKIASER